MREGARKLAGMPEPVPLAGTAGGTRPGIGAGGGDPASPASRGAGA